ncbi:MAG: hypothetical protein AXA67_00050 [Methylothermaceae bacteria B42]|nr:MAG: hypothetical protein AXA67_00050 [Methylothermaceae bacteria B42]
MAVQLNSNAQQQRQKVQALVVHRSILMILSQLFFIKTKHILLKAVVPKQVPSAKALFPRPKAHQQPVLAVALRQARQLKQLPVTQG